MLRSFLGLFNTLGGMINKLLGRAERREYREAGSNEERLRTLEGNIDAAKAKKEVDRETGRIRDTSLRDALGRFVSDDNSNDSD